MKNAIIYLKGIIVLLLMIVHSVFWCTLLFIVYLPKLVFHKPSKILNLINHVAEWLGGKWVGSNNLLLRYLSRTHFAIENDLTLDKKKQYFVTCNHQSWSDILILQNILLHKISFIRFFIKKQLMWLPVLNVAWWAYDFPIMHRATKKQLQKNPELKQKDMLATQKACAKFKDRPLTLLNFLEGTRFTPEKHRHQHSPYQHLLKPRAGGLAYALEALEHKVVNIIDVTIIYPHNDFSFLEFLGGKFKTIKIHLHQRTLPTNLIGGNYTQDEAYREAFQNWVAEIWDEKDQLISKNKFV